jgi:tripartite-type tricarboxylate transporter receptor subunit TctC
LEEKPMKAVLFTVLAVLAAAAPPDALAQKYPSKPIRLIAPFPPGGGTDILSRLIAGPVSESLGQTVVVDNRPGAGGAVGAELTAHAEPDGYTLIMVSSSYTAGAAFHKLTYDPVNGIQPILLVGTTGLVMTVHPSVPVKTPKEFIDYAKGRPGKLNYSTVGTGSVTHLAHEQLKTLAGIDIVHVPYKGGGPALTALIAGEVQVTMISMVPTLPHVRAGRLRAVGVTSPQRMAPMPDVPSIGETVRGFEVVHWYGIWGPKGLPAPIVALWNKEAAKVLLSPEMKRQMQGEGLDSGGGPPEELQKVIRRDVEKWRRVVKEANIRGE